MVKVLCLISHGVYEPWIDILHKGQETTWLSHEMPNNFEVLHFHGTPVGKFARRLDHLHEKGRWSSRIISVTIKYLDLCLGFPFRQVIPSVSKSKILKASHEVLHVHQPDTYVTYKWKEVGIFAHILKERDFDYVFTTTTSSYIRPERLIEVLSNKPLTKYYGGMIPYQNADFASGSNRIFSKDVIELIVRERANLSCGIIEDVSIAKLLKENEILPDPLFGLNLDSEEQLKLVSKQELEYNYHFRLKSGSLEKRNDVNLFKQLHATLN